MYGYIYQTTNLTNNKKYIGKHMANAFDYGYKGSGKALVEAINKYGWENFECKILTPVNNIPTICDTEEELNSSEEYYIDYFNCVDSRDYYNLKPGGLGKSCSGVVYITNGEKCKKVFPEELDFYLSNGYVIGGPKPTQETIDKRAKSNTGKKRTAEQREHLSRWQKGVPKTEEFKQKLRHPRNKPNWKKGKVAVRKDINSKVEWILKEDLDKFLSDGYILSGPKWSK